MPKTLKCVTHLLPKKNQVSEDILPKLKFTAAAVARLTPPEQGRVDYFDANLPAFGVRISHTSARKYFVMTRIYGKLARLTIGKAKLRDNDIGFSLKEAREKAGELTALAERGIDPRELREADKEANTIAAQNTFKVVGERFMEKYVKPRLSPSTVREYERALFCADMKRWQGRPVSSVTKSDIRNLLDKMVNRGSAGAANNRLAYLRKFFNWCAEEDIIEHPPTDRIKPPAPKKVGDRVLALEEISLVWKAFDAEGKLFGDLFKLLLLTGQRRAEVGGMTWDELNDLETDNPFWEIPATRTKNKRPQIVPLSSQAIDIIKSRPVFGDAGLLFTHTGETPVFGYGKIKKRIDEWIAERREKQEKSEMPSWVLHDLRRSMVTHMNDRLDISPHVVEACVNHVSGGAKMGVAGVYNKALYVKDRKKAFDAWGEFVNQLASK